MNHQADIDTRLPVRFYDDRGKDKSHILLDKILFEDEDVCLCETSVGKVLFSKKKGRHVACSGEVLTTNLDFWYAENYELSCTFTNEESMSQTLTERIQERAYLLWEQAGRPETDGLEFWQRAEAELQSTKKWEIRSGELKVEGEGPLDDVLSLALQHANKHTLALSAQTLAFPDGASQPLEIETIPHLQRLGLWE